MYDMASYWESRLGNDFSLRGSGFPHYSKSYNRWVYRAFEDCLDKVFKEGLRGKRVLDVGCGTGFWTMYFLEKKPATLTGIDITEKSINTLREKYPSVRFLRRDISKKIRGIGKYDIICAFWVLLHITNERGFRQAIENISRLAEADALIFILDVLPDAAQYPKDSDHYILRSRGQYFETLKAWEIEVIGEYPVHFFLSPPYGIKSRFLRRVSLFFWGAIIHPLARFDFSGNVLGRALYAVDSLLTALGFGASLRILACRKPAQCGRGRV